MNKSSPGVLARVPACCGMAGAELRHAPRRRQGGGHSEAEPTHFPIHKPTAGRLDVRRAVRHLRQGQLQRGLKVYKEVCSACHSMQLVPFRTLEDLGYSEAQVKAFAAEYTVQDGPNADGEMFERPGIPSDYFPSPFPNVEAAAAANNGAAPPDFSLIAKARGVERGFPTFVFDIFTQYAEGGPDYIHSLLTGYDHEPPAGMEIAEGTHYNPYFIAGKSLAMAPPLSDGQVTYDDGSAADGRPVCARRFGLPDVGRRAASRGPQEDRVFASWSSWCCSPGWSI